ncbi:hypothetical protein ACHAWO_003024 [Cyclotella atomus]|uniref:Receptor expression-enhancing protein n=1 Tax=Cyclotella atomus TaxID=382360 RepID=A0ABD3QEW8_9STRA
MGLALITARLLSLASIFHRGTIIVFGYFIPALSSVKAVVHKDSEAFFQWTTYWLILHLYSTVLSPILHFTLHPIFQLVAILWLSLPRFQGASYAYERVVVHWVKKYEVRVDDAIDEAHRSVQKWIWSKVGVAMALIVGESGNLLEVLLELIFGKPSVEKESFASKPSEEQQQQPSAMNIQQSQSSITTSSTPANIQQPRHSVRDAVRQSSTLDDFVVVDADGNTEHSIEFMAEYVNDFKTMMQQGLYVFANIETNGAINDLRERGEFRLGIFSYNMNNNCGAFLISPVRADEKTDVVVLPLYGLSSPVCTGPQGILLEWTSGKDDERIKADVVLSNEEDRDILFSCLAKCLPWMRA